MPEVNVVKATTNPFNWMRSFIREMDRAFHMPETEERAWWPAIECKRTNGTFQVTAEVPGIEKDGVNVEVLDDALVVQGERKMETKKEEDGYFRTERSYGKFYRAIPLPEGANADEIKAELANGVLTVKIPVTDVKPAARKIEVAAK